MTFKHKKVKRNYLERMSNNKILCMNTSKKYGYDYWDGNRKFGYGGYRYIEGYQTYLAQKLIKEYKLDKKIRKFLILEVVKDSWRMNYKEF